MNAYWTMDFCHISTCGLKKPQHSSDSIIFANPSFLFVADTTNVNLILDFWKYFDVLTYEIGTKY